MKGMDRYSKFPPWTPETCLVACRETQVSEIHATDRLSDLRPRHGAFRLAMHRADG
jgi:hypothetical protein